MANKGRIKIDADAEQIYAMFKQIDAESKKSSKVVTQNTKSMAASMDHFSNNVQKAGQVLLAMGRKAKTLEANQLQMKILERTNKDVYTQLQKTTEASYGLANATDMVASANKALSFGIDLSGGKLNKLTELTTKVAAVMGTDAKNAFDDLIVGIARGSKQILDNLGIMVDIAQINRDYAKQLGTTVDMLTKQQKQTALTEEAIKQLGETTKDVTKDMVEDNSKASIGLKKLEGVWDSVLKGALEGFHDLHEASTEWGEDLADGQIQLAYYVPIIGQVMWALDALFNDVHINYNVYTRELIKEEKEKWKIYKKEVERVREDLASLADDDSVSLSPKVFGVTKEVLDELKKEGEVEGDIIKDNSNKRLSLLEINAKKIADKTAFLATKEGKAQTAKNKKNALDAKREARNILRAEEARKNKLIDNIQAFDKEIMEYSGLSNEAKLAADKRYADQRLELLIDNEADLKTERLLAARDMDDVIAQARREKQITDNLKREADYRKRIIKEVAASIKANREKAASEEKEALKKKQKMLQEWGSTALNAGISGIQDTIKNRSDLRKAEKSALDGVTGDGKEAEEERARIRNEYASAREYEQRNWLKKMAMDALAGAGAKMIADGTSNVWIGGGEMLATGGVKGAATVGWGLAEIGAGIGLGAIAEAGMPSGYDIDTSKPEGAKDRMDTQAAVDKQDKQAEVNVFLHPDEKASLQKLMADNKKIADNRRN